jgi:hypothetical protein
MLEKTIGKEYLNDAQRESFLKDNCDKVEHKSYMKPYKPETLQKQKDDLADLSIEIEKVEDEKSETVKIYGDRLKELKKSRREMLKNIRQKAEYVNELCYKFIDLDERKAAWYNSEGDLVDMRQAVADELQGDLFRMKNGTEE